jgi:hypothetical protein
MREADGQPPIIATKHPGTRSCKPPLCAACCLAKASTQVSDTYSTIPNPKKVNALVHDDLNPGDRVSLDQYVSSVPGRLAHVYGKEKKRDMLTGGTIFVNHATGRVFIYNQVSARAGDTLIGKKKYERLALDSGVSVHTYHADNGIFATKEFKAHCDYKGQEVEFWCWRSPSERLHVLCSSICRSIVLNKPTWNCGLSLWNMQLTCGTICLMRTLTLPPKNSTPGTSFSATTTSLAFIHSAVRCKFSTLASKMGRRSRSGNLGLGAGNSWATIWNTC